jgi:hypothetical protein
MPKIPQNVSHVNKNAQEPVDDERKTAVQEFLARVIDSEGNTPEERRKHNTINYAFVSEMSDAEFRRLFGVIFVNGGLS